jgi:hypothetical protein
MSMSVVVTELLMKSLESASKEMVRKAIENVSKRHGLDTEEEMRVLGLVSVIRKPMTKRAKEVLKTVFPLPFVASLVKEKGCQGLQYNRGLFTQCPKKQMENGKFCTGCQSEADKNGSGCPDCGTVAQRVGCGAYEYKDSKGRSPVKYAKFLEKMKLTKEAAMEAASKENIILEEEHFVKTEKAKKEKTEKVETIRGRPKKIVTKVEADGVSDLFAKLTAEEPSPVVAEEEVVEPKKAKLSEEEKAAKKAQLEADREQKKQEREAKLAADKEEREAKRKAEAEQRKQEREAKLAAEKQEREAKRKAEQEEKKAAKLAAKETKKPKEATKEVTKEVTKEEPAAAQKVTVTRIQIDGKQYLKSSANILYDPETKEEVALYDPETKTMKDLPEDEEEEEEEGYETD